MTLGRRLPIRIRITLALIAAFALILGATGLLVHTRLTRSLDQAINDGLHTHAASVTALVAQADTGLAQASALDPERDGIAQILTPDGRVYDTVPGVTRPLLTRRDLAAPLAGRPLIVDREHGAAGIDASTRLLATLVTAQDRRLVVIVGASLESSEEASRQLATALLIGGPLALAATSLLGYVVIGAALSPVEEMRRKAAAIGEHDLRGRLPVPEANDEIRRLGETLNSMLARLQRSLDRERAFVADASHELRTPLALLKAEIELALTRGHDTRTLRAALQSASEETDRLSQLAEDMLVLARADNGKLPIAMGVIDSHALLDDLATRYRQRAHASGRTIAVNAPSGLMIHGDRIRLQQALGNLVDNALRYGAGVITISARTTSEGVELHVADQGDGIPPDFLPHAFERFTRTQTARSPGGTGLGLAIVDTIGRAHGGTTHATTGTGQSDVWLTIPDARRALSVG